MMSGLYDLIRVLFKSYYKNAEFNVVEIEKREFGFQFFDKEGMMRHIAFRNTGELKEFLKTHVPAHAYYSTALYENPAYPEMDGKGWQGADLVFDIDGDHLETPSCKDVELMTLECLNDALEEADNLLNVISDDFGIPLSRVKIIFSGHRGFHVHIEDEYLRRLTSEERRELVDYLTLRGFDVEALVKGNVILISSRLKGGIGARLAMALMDVDQRLLEDIEAHNEKAMRLARANRGLRRELKNFVRRLKAVSTSITPKIAIHVDEVVTMDVHRLIRLPNSLHGKTALRVLELTPRDLENGVEHIVDKAIAFRKSAVRVRLTRKLPVRRVMGEEVIGEEGHVIKMPLHVGLYLVSMGYAEYVD